MTIFKGTFPAWTFITAATRTPLEFVNFENLFGFWGVADIWVVDFIQASFFVQNFLHLFL